MRLKMAANPGRDTQTLRRGNNLACLRFLQVSTEIYERVHGTKVPDYIIREFLNRLN
jgi:hypothetical protein